MQQIDEGIRTQFREKHKSEVFGNKREGKGRNVQNCLMRCFITCTVRLMQIEHINEAGWKLAGYVVGYRGMRNANRNSITIP